MFIFDSDGFVREHIIMIYFDNDYFFRVERPYYDFCVYL